MVLTPKQIFAIAYKSADSKCPGKKLYQPKKHKKKKPKSDILSLPPHPPAPPPVDRPPLFKKRVKRRKRIYL